MNQYKNILIYGFTLFAMFFGSGNLVFPLQIGAAGGHNWLYGFLGLFFTGIGLPFLGLFVIKLRSGSYNTFFAEGGSLAKILLPFFILSLLGSFGIVPRCIAVAHGGFSYLYPNISLKIFSFCFCVVTFFLCLKDRIMIQVLGKILSPIKLGTMLILIFAGVYKAADTIPMTQIWDKAVINGFTTGYQTMDLFAAFFFSALIFNQVKNNVSSTSSEGEIINFALKSSFVGAFILTVIYLGLVYLGAHYSFLLKGVAPQLMLPAIAQHVMGTKATLFIAVTMLFSCLATAVALNNIYANYITTSLKINSNKFLYVLFCTTAIAFIISLMDFKGIALFLSPALEISYPGIIILTILSICTRDYKKFKMILFWSTTAVMVLYRFKVMTII